MALRLVIGLAGLHGAGKSTVAKRLLAEHGFSATSFGGVVRREAEARGFPLDLTTLQDLGAHFMNTEWGQEKFCRQVLQARLPFDSELVVIDGIRHVASLPEIRKIVHPGKFVFIYLDIDEETRLDRLTKRQRLGDMHSSRETHPVEKEVLILREHADLVVNGGDDDAHTQIVSLVSF